MTFWSSFGTPLELLGGPLGHPGVTWELLWQSLGALKCFWGSILTDSGIFFTPWAQKLIQNATKRHFHGVVHMYVCVCVCVCVSVLCLSVCESMWGMCDRQTDRQTDTKTAKTGFYEPLGRGRRRQAESAEVLPEYLWNPEGISRNLFATSGATSGNPFRLLMES